MHTAQEKQYKTGKQTKIAHKIYKQHNFMFEFVQEPKEKQADLYEKIYFFHWNTNQPQR